MNWLRRFLYGRHGVDQLSIALFFVYMVIAITSQILRIYWLYILSYSFFGYSFFRILSRNNSKRTAENTRFLYGWYTFRNRFGNGIQRMRDIRQYRYFKCPNCSRTVRVPRGKGKVYITCPKCRGKFLRKV
jgi:DNA-directed RNA polymerase subunit RPC12/RpoP